MIATTHNLLVYSLPPAESQKGKGKKATPQTSALELLHTVEIPASISEGSFRAARSVFIPL